MSKVADTIKVRPLSEAKEAYRTSGARAAEKYRQSVSRNTDQHAKSTSDVAERNYNAAMQKVLSSKRRQKMAQLKSNQQKYVEAATNIGAPNLNAGISRSGEKWEQGWGPIAQALDGMQLPDKTTDPYVNIDNRQKAVVRAMRKAAGKE